MTKGQKQGLFAILTIVLIFLGILAIVESNEMSDLSYSYFMEENPLGFKNYQSEAKTYGIYAMISFAAALFCIFMIFASKKKKGEE